jgi:hypothetical protein
MLGFKYLTYLADKGYLTTNSNFLDIGTQNLLEIEYEPALALITKLRSAPVTEKEIKELKRLIECADPANKKKSTYLSEFFDLTDVNYVSFDVCAGKKTEIFDLNSDDLPEKYHGFFDIVMNCGTLEHVINQYNSLKIIHQSLKKDGIWFDQPPSIGFINHGYFNYNPLFYQDLVEANSYGLVEIWYSAAQGFPVRDNEIPLISYNDFLQEGKKPELCKSETMPSYNLNVVMQKKNLNPFRLPLEVRTSGADVNAAIASKYSDVPKAVIASKALVKKTAKKILRNRFWELA